MSYINNESKGKGSKMQENVWIMTGATIDIVPGSTITDVINKLEKIKYNYSGDELRVLDRVKIVFSDKTHVEIDNRFDDRKLCGDD